MKKQRILALALAATTAFSMFGASLSASAAVPAHVNHDIAATLAADTAFDSVTDKATLETALAGFDASDAGLDVDVKASGVVYLMDYGIKNDATSDGIFNADLATAITNLTGDFEVALPGNSSGKVSNIKTAFTNMLNLAGAFVEDVSFTDTQAAEMGALLGDILEQFVLEYRCGVKNSDIETEYKARQALAKKLVNTDYTNAEWTGYNLAGLKADFAEIETGWAAVGKVSNSDMIYVVRSFDTIDGEIGLDRAAPDKTEEEKYNEKMDAIAEKVEEDYTAASWKKLQDAIDLAEFYAAKDDYKTANSKLDLTVLVVKKPDVAGLKAALESVSDNDTILTPAVVFTGTDTHLAYKKANCGESAWNTFAGKELGDGTDGKGGSDWNGKYYYTTSDSVTGAAIYHQAVYQAAYTIYNNARKYKVPESATQTKVDAITESLEDAVAALSSGSSTAANWQRVKLEEALDAAMDVNEDDYKTTSSIWKNFVKATEKAEDVAANEKASGSAVETAADNLVTAINNLKNCKKSVPAADKKALRDAITAAQAAVKVTEGKSNAKVTALNDAITAAKKVYNDTAATISKVLDATDAINEAVVAYNTDEPQNINVWEKQADGTWKWFDETGKYTQNGWKTIDVNYYHFTNGIMDASKWIQDGSDWYYVKSWGGACKDHWQYINGAWYYFESDAKMVSNGWKWIGGKCYYFNKSGAMAANTTIDGYKVGADGAWIK